MYTSIDHIVFDKLAGLEITCYIAIKKFANWHTQIAEVGIRRIADEMKVSKNTALKYINKLVEKKVILKRTKYNPTKKEYETNQYFFTHVVQGKEKSSQDSKTKLNKNEMIDLEEEKQQLISKYGKDVFTKALKRLSNQIKNGNCIIDTFAYLRKICMNIKQQIDLIASVSSDNVVDLSVRGASNTPQKSKIPTSPQSRYPKNKFHNFFQRTSLYSAEELNKMLLK